MQQKTTGIIDLKSIRFEVENIDENVFFYQQLGCTIEKVVRTTFDISVYLRFNQNNDVLIHLTEYLHRNRPLIPSRKLPRFEIAANEEERSAYEATFLKLQDNGIEFYNARNCGKRIPIIGEFIDLYRNRWVLNDELNPLYQK